MSSTVTFVEQFEQAKRLRDERKVVAQKEDASRREMQKQTIREMLNSMMKDCGKESLQKQILELLKQERKEGMFLFTFSLSGKNFEGINRDLTREVVSSKEFSQDFCNFVEILPSSSVRMIAHTGQGLESTSYHGSLDIFFYC